MEKRAVRVRKRPNGKGGKKKGNEAAISVAREERGGKNRRSLLDGLRARGRRHISKAAEEKGGLTAGRGDEDEDEDEEEERRSKKRGKERKIES